MNEFTTITIALPVTMFNEIRGRALDRGITVTEFIRQAVVPVLDDMSVRGRQPGPNIEIEPGALDFDFSTIEAMPVDERRRYWLDLMVTLGIAMSDETETETDEQISNLSRCETCRFARPNRLMPHLECRRHVPSQRSANTPHAWPQVSPDDWCGEWAFE